MSKPVFNSVIDLGLRDVGVRNEPRRLAGHVGRSSIPLLALAVLFAIVPCALLRQVGADAKVVVAFALAWTLVVFAVAFRTVDRAPVAVVRVDAGGRNQVARVALAWFALAALAAGLTRELVVLPVVALHLVLVVSLWRGRRRLPEALRRLRAELAEGEAVLGDGLAVARKAPSRRDAFRLVVATDRRLLMACSTRSTQPFPLLDAPYHRISRFGIEWRKRGRLGELSLTVDGEALVLTSMAPANLLSIARALQAQGVPSDEPALVTEAERGWKQALQRSRSTGDRLLDRAAMRTREFDRGLWLLLALAAFLFYLNPFGVGLGASREAVPALLGVPVLCAVGGYVARTSSALTYLAPLNLLVAPAFFFLDAGAVIAVMIALSALATVGLLAGSALRRAAARPAPPTAEGGLRAALGGLSLVRISAGMLAAMAVLVATAGAAGFPLSNVRLAIQEATAERLPVDGRSDLNGGAASLTYTPGPGLRELVTDEQPLAGPYDGARWELRSSYKQGYNVVALEHYIVRPRLDSPAAVAAFIAGKDRAHSRLAGFPVTHRVRVVDGRRGYVWDHGSRQGVWYYAAWFPQRVHSVRVECIARTEPRRFKRLCSEAMGSLRFR